MPVPPPALSRPFSQEPTRTSSPGVHTARAHPADTRMLAQQQVRLLAGMTRLLNRLLRSLLWNDLSAGERRRVLLLLTHLEHDLELLRHVTGTRRMSGAEESKATHGV